MSLKSSNLPFLAKFDGRSDPCEHVASINTQMTIIGASDSLKRKLLSGTFRDATLQWYMGRLRASIINYQELVKKLYISLVLLDT